MDPTVYNCPKYTRTAKGEDKEHEVLAKAEAGAEAEVNQVQSKARQGQEGEMQEKYEAEYRCQCVHCTFFAFQILTPCAQTAGLLEDFWSDSRI